MVSEVIAEQLKSPVSVSLYLYGCFALYTYTHFWFFFISIDELVRVGEIQGRKSSMETLTTTSGAVSLPIFSPNKPKNLPSRRFLRFSASPENNSNSSEPDSADSSIVPFFRNRTMSEDAAMGLVLSAADVRGWTTGSGMEGPPVPAGSDSGLDQVSTFPWSLFTKSPRRRMRVAFTCNVCGQRTTRAINPHAYTDGTVFVQCCGCNIFHKLVDNLNLFDEMKCYVNSSFNPNPINNMNFKYFDLEEDNSDDIFPLT